MRKLAKVGRAATLMASLPAIFVALVVATIAMIWWQLVGMVTWVLGATARKHTSRWLGCYPFLYTLLGLLWTVAWFHWGATGEKIRPFYSKLCAECLDKLDGDEGLAKIGGLW